MRLHLVCELTLIMRLTHPCGCSRFLALWTQRGGDQETLHHHSLSIAPHLSSCEQLPCEFAGPPRSPLHLPAVSHTMWDT